MKIKQNRIKQIENEALSLILNRCKYFPVFLFQDFYFVIDNKLYGTCDIKVHNGVKYRLFWYELAEFKLIEKEIKTKSSCYSLEIHNTFGYILLEPEEIIKLISEAYKYRKENNIHFKNK